MKKFILLAVFLGLVSNSAFAMQEERKPEGAREEIAQASPKQELPQKEKALEQQEFEAFMENSKSVKSFPEAEAIILRLSNEGLKRIMVFMEKNNLQTKFPGLYRALNRRIFVQTGDGTIRHYEARILNTMNTIKDLIADAGEDLLVDKNPLILPRSITDRQFFALYQIVIALYSASRPEVAKGANVLVRERHQIALHIIKVILNRNGLSSTDVLEAAYYLSLTDLLLTVLAEETALEIVQYKKAFPMLTADRSKPGFLHADFLPEKIKALDKNILGMTMRQFYLIHPNEHKLRTISTCFDPNDMFCSKSLRVDLPIKPFSIAELLAYGKIEPISNGVLNLSYMNIDDLTGFDAITNVISIATLRLSNNKIVQLPDNFLSTCRHLQLLDLNSNKLQQLPNGFLNKNNHLGYLDLHSNQLRELPDNFLSNNLQLHRLSLANNQLQQLPNNFLANNSHMTLLGLENNELRALPDSLLQNKHELQKLSLKNNQLSNEIIEGIRAILLADGKAVDGVNIMLEPQKVEAQPAETESNENESTEESTQKIDEQPEAEM